MSELRPSLVFKLNIRMLASQIFLVMMLNLVLSIITIGTVLYTVEEGAGEIIEYFNNTDIRERPLFYDMGGYYVTPIPKASEQGDHLPRALSRFLPIKSDNVKRAITGTELEHLNYQLTFQLNAQPYQLTYDLSKIAYRLYVIGIIILILEVLLIIRSLNKGYHAIKITLLPIAKMAEEARKLNAQVNNEIISGQGLESLTGEISSIDGSQLDKRIAVDESHKELKDLARAINLMLNRISSSYKSQIRFVSDASHELRTPISVIQGYVNLLDRWGKNDEKTMQEAIDAIKSETENMKTLVEHLLFLARGDNDTLQLHKEQFDISELIDEIVQDTKIIGIINKIDVQLERPLNIVADKQLMKQAIRILLDNSIKYSPDDKPITIKASSITLSQTSSQTLQTASAVSPDTSDTTRQVLISVQDNGIGIPPEDVAHIFDRFYRSDESRARNTGGSGLGLSIAKWIIERHQGEIEVVSMLDVGTRTTIIL